MITDYLRQVSAPPRQSITTPLIAASATVSSPSSLSLPIPAGPERGLSGR